MKKMAQFSSWCESAAGQRLFAQEAVVLNELLSQCIGYYLLHLGSWPMPASYTSTHIKNQYVISPRLQPVACQQVCAQLSDLPFANDSVDAVLCPHVLEFITEPHQLLRDIERVLVPEGHILISCFNPFSLWHLLRLARFWDNSMPPGRFFRAATLQDWLSLLGFDIIKTHPVPFFPALPGGYANWLMRQLDPLRKKWWHGWGGVFIILARKKTIALTPIKYKWRLRRKIITAGIAEPSARTRG